MGLLLVFRDRLGGLDDDVGRLTADFGLKALLRVGGVGNGTDESVRVDDRVAALDHVAVALFLAVLVVGELVVLDVETELVGWVGLRWRWKGNAQPVSESVLWLNAGAYVIICITGFLHNKV